MTKPKILISACLEFEKVRYNGQFIPSQIIRDLIPFAEFIKVCPENEIGLGVPREPIRIVKKEGQYRLIQHKTERDVTDEMESFSESFTQNLKEVDGFIFKSKSPTMGTNNIKVYSSIEKGSAVVDKCGGFFASKIANRYRGYPIEEDDRLRNPKIRDHFLTRTFLFSRFREALEKGTLEDFHQQNHLLLEFYNTPFKEKLNLEEEEYFDKIKKITAKPPFSEDIASFFQKFITTSKKDVEKYRDNKITLATLKEISKIFIKEESLLQQTFFQPYPEELLLPADENRDKNYW